MRTMSLPNSLFSLLACALLMLSSAGRGQALSQDKDEIVYTVRNGDTLIGLGSRYFVSAEAYRTVQRINRIPDSGILRVGSTIVIPTNILKFTPLEARVIAFKGRATSTRAGRSADISVGSRLAEESLIETAADGYLTIQLPNGSKVAIPSNSRVRLTRMRTYLLTRGTDTDFVVERGRTETSVVPLRDNRSRFRVRTPVAISAVRGTVFRIGYDGPDSASLTEVVEGSVAVNLSGSATRTSLPTGFGAAASPSGKLDREALLPPPAFVDGSALQRGSDVIFRVEGDLTAIGYHIQIANDAAFDQIVTDARSQTATVNLGPLPNGAYFARATAIAPSGLEGLPQSQGFTRKLEALQSSPASGPKGGYRLQWELGAPDSLVFRLQLFTGTDSQIPLIDEPGLTGNDFIVYGLAPGSYSWRIGRVRSDKGRLQQYLTPFESFTIPN